MTAVAHHIGSFRPAEGAEQLTQAVPAEEVQWMLWGACNDYDPELWFPRRDAEAKWAKKICVRCPVLAQCRIWALEKRETVGVWGGLSQGERWEIWNQRKRKRRR